MCVPYLTWRLVGVADDDVRIGTAEYNYTLMNVLFSDAPPINDLWFNTNRL